MDQGTANRPAAHPRGERGFSLVETLFAVLVLVVAGGGLVRTLAQASRARQAAADTDLATRIAVTETRNHLEGGSTVQRVVFACFGAEASTMYRAVIDDIFPHE